METSRLAKSYLQTLSNWFPAATATRYNRWLIAAFSIVAIICSLPPIINHLNGILNKDYPLWYATGQKVINGECLYPTDQAFPFMYPPIAAILLAPLSFFGPLAMIVALVAINAMVWLASILLSVYLATGKSLRQHPLVYLLPTLCSVAFGFDNFQLGQPNILLLAILLGAFACLRNGREWIAGALVALAVGIKAFPLMAVVYLVYRRHWIATLSTVVSLVVLFAVVPAAVRGPRQALEDTTVWARGMLLNYDKDAIGQRTLRAYSWKNQSLIGLTNRLLRHKSADEDRPFYVNFTDWSHKTTYSIIVGIALGLCLFYIGVMPRYRARTPHSDSIEYAMLLLLILMFSPYTFGYYYIWLLYPFTVLVSLWIAEHKPLFESRFGLIFVMAASLLALSMVRQRYAEVYGNFFLASLLLLLTLGWHLLSLKMRPAQPREADIHLPG